VAAGFRLGLLLCVDEHVGMYTYRSPWQIFTSMHMYSCLSLLSQVSNDCRNTIFRVQIGIRKFVPTAEFMAMASYYS